MARGGHRMVSLATKAKISASLRGNKNAFRGGPKKRLSAREKVANINAHTKANRVNLSDAQLRQRAAVAKRLRARARSEEAGINPNHSKPIATPNTIEQRDSKIRANVSRAKGSIAKAEQNFTRAGRGKQDRTGKNAAVARTPGTMSAFSMGHREAVRKRIADANRNGRISSNQRDQANHKLDSRMKDRASRNTAKRIAQMNTGNGGNFNKIETSPLAQRLIARNQSTIAEHEAEILMIEKAARSGAVPRSESEKRQGYLLTRISDMKESNRLLRTPGLTDAAIKSNRLPKADRSKPSTDPLTKRTASPKSLPQRGLSVSEIKRLNKLQNQRTARTDAEFTELGDLQTRFTKFGQIRK